MIKNKVLILGGGGFIGINIAKYLNENRDFSITIADKVFSRNLDEYFSKENQKKIRFIKDDFTQIDAFKQLENNYDYLYMMASVVGVNPTLEFPEEVIRINTNLILNTLEWLKKTDVRKVLFASSSECYAGTTEKFNYPIPTSEEVPLCVDDIKHPRFTYAITKMLGESAFLNYARKANFDTTIVRYQNAFGPDMGFKHVIPHLVERFHKKESPYRIYGTEQTRAFCYISDSAEGTVLAMESENANGEIYHIGSMDEISMETLTKEVGRLFNYKGEYKNEPTYPGSVKRRCPDIAKAREDLGYNPRIHWTEGVRKTVQWYRAYFDSGRVANDGGGFSEPENFLPKEKKR